MYVIESFGLTKYYSNGKVKALQDFNLSVEQGTIFSLLGPNGSGKTTLIKVLLNIVHPTRGEGRIFGKKISDHRTHKKLGYLPENHRFPVFLNAIQILLIYGKMCGIQKSILKERIPRLLATVKLSDWAKIKIKKYSKGMLQRLGMAQALINDPEILFLDEPTDGIDPVGRREIRDLLLTLKGQGKTIFLNSHLLSEVERISDEIAILKRGRLIKKGRVQDFLSLKDQYELSLEGDHPTIRQSCDFLNILLEEQNSKFLISVNNDEHLNKLIDELRKNKIFIKGITPRKITLEDYFIEVIEEKGNL